MGVRNHDLNISYTYLRVFVYVVKRFGELSGPNDNPISGQSKTLRTRKVCGVR